MEDSFDSSLWLPEDLLTVVCSFLHVRALFRTTKLSKLFWRPRVCDYRLVFRDGTDLNTGQSLYRFIDTFNKVLSQLKSSSITSVELAFHHPFLEVDELDKCYAAFDSCMSEISAVRPVSLHVFFDFVGSINIPLYLFNIPSIVSITMSAPLYCSYPQNNFHINLPELKELCLYKVEFDPHVLMSLFTSLPKLEALKLGLLLMEQDQVQDQDQDQDQDHHNVVISAPNLKKFVIHMLGTSSESAFTLDVPLLEEFEAEYGIAKYTFTEKPSNLSTVTIDLWSPVDKENNHYFDPIPTLLEQVSNANTLKLGDDVNLFALSNATAVWPSFRNVKHLLLGVYKTEIAITNIPSCLLSTIERLDLSAVQTDGNDVIAASISHIVPFGLKLRILSIDYYGTYGAGANLQLCKEENMCWNMFQLSRSYTSCRINFVGIYIQASSYGPEKTSFIDQKTSFIDHWALRRWSDFKDEEYYMDEIPDMNQVQQIPDPYAEGQGDWNDYGLTDWEEAEPSFRCWEEGLTSVF